MATQNMNEAYKASMEEHNNLLNTENFIELISTLEPVNPTYHFNRLIGELFPESEYNKQAKQYDYNFPKDISKLRNILIKSAISSNMHENITLEEHNFTQKQVKEILTGTGSGSIYKIGLDRNKVFICALVLNLTYDQMIHLLVHSVGERVIDFKNPYEVILTYCTISHVNVLEHYENMVREYRLKSVSNSDHKDDAEENQATQLYEESFKNINTDDELMDFALSLPRKRSQSTYRVFMEQYDEITSFLEDNPNSYNNWKTPGEKFPLDASAIKKELFGSTTAAKNSGVFKLFRKDVFSSSNFDQLINNELPITKHNIMQVLFWKYSLYGENFDALDEAAEKKQKLLPAVYENFRYFCSGPLAKAGFDDFYISDYFERFLMSCILTEDPLKTFKMIMEYNENG